MIQLVLALFIMILCFGIVRGDSKKNKKKGTKKNHEEWELVKNGSFIDVRVIGKEAR